MKRLLCLLPLLLLALCPGLALGHSGHQGVAYTEVVQVGPVQTMVDFSEWPVVAQKSLQIVVAPAGGIAGKSATLTMVPKRGVKGHMEIYKLQTYPGIPNAWTLNLEGIPGQGEWTFRVEITGADGTWSAALQPVEVAPPPSVPKWSGWLLALTPVLLFSGFVGLELIRYPKRARANGNAWA
jgi:hypothetical protein